MKQFCLLISVFLFCNRSIAQTYNLRGTLVDAKDTSGLISAAVAVSPVADSTQFLDAETDDDGNFQIAGLKNGQYILKATYIGYKSLSQTVTIAGADANIGTLKMSEDSKELSTVVVETTLERVVQNKDTTQYNANAFKTNPDAVAADLVAKMPGITNNNGQITAQGQAVQKVLIDGKEFFGSDVNTALQNLPADVIDQVQVFDRMSDQAAFTGFDDGNSQKTINIKTKRGITNAWFGKVYGGFGYINNARYSAGGNVNWFKGDRRISLLVMSNNVNQQNFSSDDLAGVMNGTSGGGGRGGGGGSGGGGGAASTLTAAPQSGISTSHAVGFNFNDVWGKKKNFKFQGSYFFNLTNNVLGTSTKRDYFNTGDNAQHYQDTGLTKSRNINNRASLRMEWTIDSGNSMIFTPTMSIQNNNQDYTLSGATNLSDGNAASTVTTHNTNKVFAYNISAGILYRHKFGLPGRTLSVGITPTVNNRNGNSSQYSFTDNISDSSSSVTNQQGTISSKNYGFNASLNYTEPVGKNSQLQFMYTPSYTWQNSDKETNVFDSLTGGYTNLNTALSSKYSNTYITQRGGFSYRYRVERFNIMAQFNLQYASLNGNSVFPYSYTIDKSFTNILPMIRFQYNFKNKSNLRIFYRTSTNAPSIQQLQSVIDNSNVLLQTTGNAELKQSYTHSLNINYGWFNAKNSNSLFLFLNASTQQNYIGTSTFIATADTVLAQGDTLRKGSQLQKPVNLNGYWNASFFATYGLPVKALKSNLNINLSFAYNHLPSLINNAVNWANNYAVGGGLTLSSNISQNIDFTINYAPTYTIVYNTLQQKSNNNYYNHNASVKFNWIFWKGFLFSTTLQNTVYAGMAQGYNQDLWLWGVALGYKFLKDKSLDLRCSVNDILNQNSSISRTVNANYIQDTRTQVLKRYFLLTLTYTFKTFNGNLTQPNSNFSPGNVPPSGFPSPNGGGGYGMPQR